MLFSSVGPRSRSLLLSIELRFPNINRIPFGCNLCCILETADIRRRGGEGYTYMTSSSLLNVFFDKCILYSMYRFHQHYIPHTGNLVSAFDRTCFQILYIHVGYLVFINSFKWLKMVLLRFFFLLHDNFQASVFKFHSCTGVDSRWFFMGILPPS